ncbi:uncharacterized protein MONOS_17295 [Monocercomonoides exilis]|uniref:uncharacterized protein n=1 Tax=Monocercomonoides exilis TaxID=2049356 RepID=UPI0035597888|nr:hypothetical protein MONOS_17295 [Monocercomonoides exilis]
MPNQRSTLFPPQTLKKNIVSPRIIIRDDDDDDDDENDSDKKNDNRDDVVKENKGNFISNMSISKGKNSKIFDLSNDEAGISENENPKRLGKRTRNDREIGDKSSLFKQDSSSDRKRMKTGTAHNMESTGTMNVTSPALFHPEELLSTCMPAFPSLTSVSTGALTVLQNAPSPPMLTSPKLFHHRLPAVAKLHNELEPQVEEMTHRTGKAENQANEENEEQILKFSQSDDNENDSPSLFQPPIASKIPFHTLSLSTSHEKEVILVEDEVAEEHSPSPASALPLQKKTESNSSMKYASEEVKDSHSPSASMQRLPLPSLPSASRPSVIVASDTTKSRETVERRKHQREQMKGYICPECGNACAFYILSSCINFFFSFLFFQTSVFGRVPTVGSASSS